MPRLSPEIALNAEALLQKAATQTGLSDFGDDAFREPYELLLQSLREEARLNTQGVIMLQRTILRLLVNRLLTEQAFAANPEMAKTPIEQPLYILGFPRTGTTLLHNAAFPRSSRALTATVGGTAPSPVARVAGGRSANSENREVCR
jgi:hypothetical protein